MTKPLVPGDDHNLLSNRSKGDPHAQYRQLSNVTFPSITIETTNGTITFSIIEDPGVPGQYVLDLTSSGDLPVMFQENVIIRRTDANALVVKDGSDNVILQMDTTTPAMFWYGNATFNPPGTGQLGLEDGEISLLGSLLINRTAVSSSPYNVASSDFYLAVDTTVAITINLPSATVQQMLVIKDATGTGAATNNITITPDGTDTCEVASITGNRDCVWLISDGTSNWEWVAGLP